MQVIKQLMVPIDLFISLIWKSMGMNNIFKNIFCVQLKKETYTGLEQHEGK